MIPRHFPRMVLAEIRKVFTQGSAIAALSIALVVGIGAVAGYAWVQSFDESGPSFNGTPVSQIVIASGIETAGKALWARNFFVLPLFLLLASASSVGGELADRTLRELVVRPVPRWSILAAKLVALSTLSAATLVVTLVPSLGAGTALFGLTSEGASALGAPLGAPGVGALLGGYAASFLSDVGLICIATAASLVVPSVGGTVVGVALLLMADLALWGLLKLLGAFGVAEAAAVIPWTLGNALGGWKGWQEGWEPAQFGALAVFVAVSLTFAIARFHRMDVP
ncbi:MAG: ABC transporter permease subunit [Pseudomonadota bacterium]|nr:ABC transporter permease subunit [Pseudomonadota bacterium]